MTRSPLLFASAMIALLMPLMFASPAMARQIKGARTKGWRRRAQDWEEAKGPPKVVKSTIVTNPGTLGKGQGKGKEVIFSTWDESGRTTFVIDCNERTARKAGSPIDQPPVKLPPPKLGDPLPKLGGKGGKGSVSGSGLSSVSSGSEPSSASDGSETIEDEEAKAIPANICDDVEEPVDGDDSGGGFTGDGSGNGGEMDVGLSNGGTEYPPEEQGTSGSGVVEQANGGLYGCAEVIAGNAPTTDAAESVVVTLDVIHEIEPNVQDGGSATILKLMRADLQDAAAAVIADCMTNEGGVKPSGSRDYDVAAGSGIDGIYGNDTLITNVVFQELTGDTSGCSQGYQDEAAKNDGICVLTTVPVVLYYQGDDTSNFKERVQTAIDEHKWEVPGLMMTSTVHRDSDNSIAAIETEEALENDTIGPAGYLTIAAAALVLLLLALMLVRRKRRDEMVKHVSLEDDDDTYLRDIEGESDAGDRLANVVGEDSSVGTGWTGASHFRNASAMDAYFSNTEERPSHQDVHMCSSATCEVCERNRQSGVQFIPSGTNMTHAPLPPDAPREYSADDTVCL